MKAGEKQRRWKNHGLHQNFRDFVDRLLQYNPEKRLGMKGWDELKEHPFFKDATFDWEALESKKMESPLRDLVQG